ncbi:MAG: two-component system response regulator CreB [Verrucomicrobiota bacterium]
MPKRKILIVEDEPPIAENIAYALQTDGFDTTWCTTGEDALGKIKSESFDLVVLDVGLPDQSGFEVCQHIRSLGTDKDGHVAIIFLTARSDEIDRVVGLEIGGDDYVLKPFSPRELCARIKAILRRTNLQKKTQRKESQALPPTENPNLSFVHDEAAKCISYKGEALELSRYEYRLLALFMKRPGRVYSRDELMTQIWEDPGASLDRTVDAHIKQLRAKLRTIHSHTDPIKTHRGLGYSLKEL